MISKQYLVKTCLLMFLLILAFFLVQQNIITHIADKQWVEQYIHQSSFPIKLLFMLSCSLLLSVGFPRPALAFIFGYLFGLKVALLLNFVILGISCSLSFYVARFFIRPLINRWFNKKIVTINKWVKEKAWLKIIFIRLLPIGNNAITNLLAGASAISFKDFLIGSLIGYQPQAIIFASAGAGLAVGDQQKFIISIVSLMILFIISIYLYKSNSLKE